MAVREIPPEFRLKPDGPLYRRVAVKWDEIQLGDLLFFPYVSETEGENHIGIELVEPCGLGSEYWHNVCRCDQPTCSWTLKTINVRQALKRGVIVARVVNEAD